MNKRLKKAMSFMLVLVMLLTITSNLAVYADETSKLEKAAKSSIQQKYNPLRTDSNKVDKEKVNKVEPVDYNDENVVIETVTYYDTQGNQIAQYKGKEAIDHLVNEEIGIKDIKQTTQIQQSALSDSGRFLARIIVSYVGDNSKITVKRQSPLDISQFNVQTFIFDAGLAFIKPIQSILYAAVSQFLPTSMTYKARDVVETELYRYWNKTVELKDSNYADSKWFAPIIQQRRLVDLSASFYLIDSTGSTVTNFLTSFGTVEENYARDYYASDSTLFNLAYLMWDQHPYYHTYSWNPVLNSNAQTVTFNPTPVITKYVN